MTFPRQKKKIAEILLAALHLAHELVTSFSAVILPDCIIVMHGFAFAFVEIELSNFYQ